MGGGAAGDGPTVDVKDTGDRGKMSPDVGLDGLACKVD